MAYTHFAKLNCRVNMNDITIDHVGTIQSSLNCANTCTDSFFKMTTLMYPNTIFITKTKHYTVDMLQNITIPMHNYTNTTLP